MPGADTKPTATGPGPGEAASKRPSIAIVTALGEELEGILQQARGVRRRPDGLLEARFGSAPTLLTATGDGAGNAARGAARLCDSAHPAALIGVGVAGALTASLKIGDLVAGLRVRDASGEAPAPDARLLSWALSSGAKAGTLVTVAAPVVSPAEKTELAASLDGDTFAVVDMESAAWARTAAERGVPYVVVRAVSDLFDEELPEYLRRAVDRDGHLRRGAVIGFGLSQPRSIPTLLRLRKRVDECATRLGTFLQRLLGEAP
jgi:adenosylhomocysteine nucleosidase